MRIDTLHTNIYNLVSGTSAFNQGFYEMPKKINDEKLPAFAVYFLGHTNSVSTSRTNKRTYNFAIDLIYDKENMSTTQTVTSDLVSSVIDTLEDHDNITLSGQAHYVEPTISERIEDYVIAGKTYLAYRITLPVVVNTSI